MSIQTDIERVLELQHHFKAFKSELMDERRSIVTRTLPPELQAAAGDLDDGVLFSVKGSNGQGNAAKVPWVRIYDPAQSPSSRSGWYVVLLFAADGSAAYLSLDLGVTELSSSQIAQEVTEGRRLLADYREVDVDIERERRVVRTISLHDIGLGARYEQGNLLAFKYTAGQVPLDEEIAGDLKWLLARLKEFPAAADSEIWNEPDPQAFAGGDDGLSQLSSDINWPVERVLEIFEGLMDESPQVALTGPPGTGKTFVAHHLAAYLLGMPGEVKNNPYIELVQFHPSYGYEDFVEGLRPVPADGGLLEFRSHPGAILRLADQIEEDAMPRVLIIDEMNRANIPRVFGELMFLLEYRDRDIHLMHRAQFSLPKNLYIIATMNTADRSTKSIDLALRRRFDFFELAPDVEVLRSHYLKPENNNELGETLFKGFVSLNNALEASLGDRHLAVGHSYLMKDRMTMGALTKIWKHQLMPLIEDYFYDQPAGAEALTFEAFWGND
ncbi:McrB family protein [Conyzicola sp.]|uniref:McrB family protein n=1 Tax=Conyzicola sp. TaxID=1969404 RepID=UPI00398931CF